MDKKIRIIISGIGNRALPKNVNNSYWLGWVELIKRSKKFQLIAAHDVSEESIKRIVERGYLKPEYTYQNIDMMLSEVSCDAMLICNPAKFHGKTIRKALDYDLHVLVEKPFVNNIAEGREIIELNKKKGKVIACVQNWRTKDVGRLLFEFIKKGELGRIGHIFFRYIRDRENPNYPSYIFDEDYPLLYAMSIHHLDLFRYIIGDEFKYISGHSFRPHWSFYKSDTGLNLILKTKRGVTIVYSGTISSRSKIIPQESLIIEGEKGTLFNESQWLEPPLLFFPYGKNKEINLTKALKKTSIADQYNKSDNYILRNFYNSIILNKIPICTASDGLNSIVLLEASRKSFEAGKTVQINHHDFTIS